MSISHTFEKCSFCQCNSEGISIVLCGNSQCRKIFCSACGEIYLSGVSSSNTDVEGQESQPVAGCIHCWTVRPLIWSPPKGEPQIGKKNEQGKPIERHHIRLGEIVKREK
jgi:hypothetical protein